MSNPDDLENDRAIVAEFADQLRRMKMPKVATDEGREAMELIGGALGDIWIESKTFTQPKGGGRP